MSLTLESSPGSLENPHVGGCNELMNYLWLICLWSTLPRVMALKKVGGCLGKEKPRSCGWRFNYSATVSSRRASRGRRQVR